LTGRGAGRIGARRRGAIGRGPHSGSLVRTEALVRRRVDGEDHTLLTVAMMRMGQLQKLREKGGEQYPVCLQKNQRGSVELTVTEKDGTEVALAATGWKLESIPPDMGRQGLANVDCVTEWFLGRKTKETISPMAAVICCGL
jgi:hypothetical protein